VFAAMALAALIGYGSLVPFDLTTPFNPIVGLERIPFTPWSGVSRTDILVNLTVGLALGFFLMGAWRSTCGQSRVAGAVGVLVVACLSTILAMGVEMLQAFSPTRDSSWNDVSAQTLGAILGTLAWAVTGRKVLGWLRHLSREPEPSRLGVGLLQIYLPIYLLLQLTPLDTFKAAKLATKFAEGRVVLVPPVPEVPSTLLVLRDCIGNALLNVPIGMLAALGWCRKDKRRALGPALLLGASMIVAVGIAQPLVGVGGVRLDKLAAAAFGVTCGVVVARRFLQLRPIGPMDRSPLGRVSFLVAATAWVLVLIGQNWYPFDFGLTSVIVERRLTRASLVPFVFYYWFASYTLSPWQAVHEGLLQFVFAVPLGLCLRLGWGCSSERRVRQLQGLAITIAGMTVLLGIEFAQTFLPTRFPDLTDVLIGTMGVLVGDLTARAFADRRRAIAWSLRREESALDAPVPVAQTKRLQDEPSTARS
jgi:VanZ family protein